MRLTFCQKTIRAAGQRILAASLIVLLGMACSSPPSEQVTKNVKTNMRVTPTSGTARPSSTPKTADNAPQNMEMPNGVNLPACKPQPGRNHIFLIHGTLHSSMLSFKALAPRLRKDGHCLYAADYGAFDANDPLKARKPVADNAREVGEAIDRVLKQTGQPRIDLLGYSQGGLIGFYLIRDQGFAGKVRHFTAVAPSVRGTTSEGALRMNQANTCPACADQFHQSTFIRTFLSKPVTVPTVTYTVVATRDDWIVTPPENQLINEANVRNVMVQDRLNGKTISHVGMVYDPDAVELIAALVNEGSPGQTMGR